MRPTKSLGQHFLSDYGVVNRIVAAAEAGPDAVVIEVGPGLGVLTERLAETAGRLIAVEIDRKLARRLREELAARTNVMVVERDVLLVTPGALLAEAGIAANAGYSVVGNLPYNAGAAILRHFLEADNPPRSIVAMLQREVADSIAGGPGKMSLLGVSVQVYARARKLFNVAPRAFYPPPRVTSSVIRLEALEQPLIAPDQREAFFRVVRAGFSAPRKQLRNTLAQGLGVPAAQVSAMIQAAGLEPTLRPQDVPLEGWLRLAEGNRAYGRAGREPS
ncbi:MAG TPA: 16S rRNA (adenine(1518)-N(6)/adenine(1519)-N(6))-dimethyltransferase RsmA [Dehalococcoidia bacterium]|nr:16S rRNA (adenine(1518)-N(6)/adenine(1519)-N(6))-dimethyltransferase RsmA [Dehalococcoidia bacterium]